MAYAIFLGGLLIVLAGLTWFARWAKGRGHGSGLAGAVAAYEEAYRPTSHHAHQEQRVAADRQAEAGSPDDL
ncbi:hypothetical protein ACI2LF_00825 [Kribbella sp. NPDC020789]